MRTGIHAEDAAIRNGRRRRPEIIARKARRKKEKRADRSASIAAAIVYVFIFAVFFTITLLIAAGSIKLGYSETQADFIADAGLGLSMTASVLAYLYYYKRLSMHEILVRLGLTHDKLSWRIVGIGILIFVFFMLLNVAVGAVGAYFHQTINTNVAVLFAGAPAWFYAFSAVIEPINEEILFRGFLVPRLGIVISAILFGLGHVGYNSSFEIEVIAAAIFGIIAGYVFRKTKSLYPSIIAHILVNSVAVIALLAVIL